MMSLHCIIVLCSRILFVFFPIVSDDLAVSDSARFAQNLVLVWNSMYWQEFAHLYLHLNKPSTHWFIAVARF